MKDGGVVGGVHMKDQWTSVRKSRLKWKKRRVGEEGEGEKKRRGQTRGIPAATGGGK